jgi:hypothetical protein
MNEITRVSTTNDHSEFKRKRVQKERLANAGRAPAR